MVAYIPSHYGFGQSSSYSSFGVGADSGASSYAPSFGAQVGLLIVQVEPLRWWLPHNPREEEAVAVCIKLRVYHDIPMQR